MSDRPEPKKVMFMSADIVGSTTFKENHKSTGDVPSWLPAFEKFFRELPLVFIGQIAIQFDDVDDVPETGVWRVSGDEIVFSIELTDDQTTTRLLKAFLGSVSLFDKRLYEFCGLNLRGCCWVASFPGRNIEIEVPEMAVAGDRTNDIYREYLGPDVDLGFRLSGYPNAGENIISLELAMMMRGAIVNRDLSLSVEGYESLKGLFAGCPYPIIKVAINPESAERGIDEEDLVRIDKNFRAALESVDTPSNRIIGSDS